MAESTNIRTPNGQAVKANIASSGGQSHSSTSGSGVNSNRTVSVKIMQGSIRLRYAPLPPKVVPNRSR